MKKLQKTIVVGATSLVAIGIFLVVNLVTINRAKGIQAELRGRDFVQAGELGGRMGLLLQDRGEWFIELSEGMVYQLHLGDHAHRATTGIQLEAGLTAAVIGYFHQDSDLGRYDIAVCTIRLDGQVYYFREYDGTPLWRGQGRGERHQASGDSKAGYDKGDISGCKSFRQGRRLFHGKAVGDAHEHFFRDGNLFGVTTITK